MLKFSWSIGRDISHMELTAKYGSGFYKRLSSDLKAIFPDVGSFSVTNLKYMKYFYDLYAESTNRPQLVDDFSDLEIIYQIPW